MKARAATDIRAEIAEIAEILAAGLVRVLARQSSSKSPHTGESSLHNSPDQSGHPAPRNAENSDE